MKLLLVILLICSGTHMHAQSSGQDSEDQSVSLFFDGNYNDGVGSLSTALIKESTPITIGNVYLFKKWVNNAKMVSTTNKEFKIIGLNYNIEKGKFQIKISKDSVFTLDSNYIDHILVNNRNFIKLDQKNNSNGFYEMIYDGKNISFVKKAGLRLIKGKLNPLDGSISPNKYHKFYTYYISKDNTLTKIKLKKKAIAPFFKDSMSKVNTYVKRNNLSYKKEKDVMQILSYLDTL